MVDYFRAAVFIAIGLWIGAPLGYIACALLSINEKKGN